MATYMILHNRITDQAKMDEYVSKVMPTFEPYGPELLVMDETSEVVEGETSFPRTIVIKFDDREKAMGWYNCAEYGAIRDLRLDGTEGFAVICDGFAPPGA